MRPTSVEAITSGDAEGLFHRSGERLGECESVAVVAYGDRQAVIEIRPSDRVAEARVAQDATVADDTVRREPVAANSHTRDGPAADIELVGIGAWCKGGADSIR